MEILPLLTIIIFLPMLGAFAIILNRGEADLDKNRNARMVALWTSVVTFILSLVLWYNFDVSSSEFQFVDTFEWIPSLNIVYMVGIDGISLPFVLLSTFLIPLCILSSWTSIRERVPEFMVAFLVLETLLIGAFAALDFVLFYLFFEGILIPMFFIIGIWGGSKRIYAALKFFLYTLAGSVFMLLAIIYILYVVNSSSIPLALSVNFGSAVQIWLWLAFFASFAVKIPMWPLHTWLPDAHVEAPTAGSVILAGVLLKMGGYGFLRFSIPMFPEASAYFSPFIFILSIVAIIYASFVALAQTDMKKLIAYSSVAHMGFVTLGIFTVNTQGVQGAVLQMVSHGIISASLFLCVGVVYDRFQSREIAGYRGLVHYMPVYAAIFMLFILASIGLPGTSGFIGEFLVLIGAFQISTWVASMAALGMVLGAAYALWLYRRIILGDVDDEKFAVSKDLTIREKLTFTPLSFAVLAIGIFPTLILKPMNITVGKLINKYNIALETKIKFKNDKNKSIACF